MVPRGTPLYGQPSWWGDADDESAKNETKTYDPEQLKCEAGEQTDVIVMLLYCTLCVHSGIIRQHNVNMYKA